MSPRHRRETDTRKASEKLSVYFAARPAASRIIGAALSLVALATVGTAVAYDGTDGASSALTVATSTAPAKPFAAPEDVDRESPVSRSFSRTADVTVDLRQYRVRQAIEEAEKKAAAEKKRLARIAARQEARRQAAEEARRKAAQEAAERAAEQAAADAAATDPGSLRDMARREMIAFGFAADQWTYLDQLVMRESGWNPRAQNPSSGAYGLPQALPGSKMASEGADWQTNPVTQIRWMLKYIAGRYGTPAGAWSHSQSVGWY